MVPDPEPLASADAGTHARRAGDRLARVQVELAQQAAAATPLSELAGGAVDLSRVEPLLRRVLDAVCDLAETEMAAVWVVDPVAAELYPAAWTGLSDDYIGPLRVPFGDGSAGRAVAERRPVLVPDITDYPDYDAYRDGARAHGITSVYSIPMLTLAGEPMGTLSAYHSEATSPGPRALQLLETLAGQAGEIVERARMHADARALAELERRRAQQLRALADAAGALTAADDLEQLLRVVTDSAVSIVGCHQGVATRLRHGWVDATTYVALSETYAAWRDYDVVPKGLGVLNAVTRENRPLRLTGEQLVAHPEWRGLQDAPDHPPLPDYLAAPFVGRDGRNLGLVQLSHKTDDSPFSAEDEAIVVQLTRMASSVIERLEALAGERTARQEAERAAVVRGLLSDASAAFAESLEPAEVAEQLVALAVPRLAEIAVLHLLDDRGAPELSALRCQDPEHEHAARAVLSVPGSLDPDAAYGVHAVLRERREQLLPEVTDEMIASIASDAESALLLRGVARRSGLVVPLIARGRMLGALSLGRDEPYGQAEVDHAVELARRAALSLDNAARYAFERELATTLQTSLLPRQLPTSTLMTSAARYLPGARGTRVGGDWYDLLEVDAGGLLVVVGDVMGRGVQAAAVMGQLRAAVRAFALEGHGPADVLRLLDRVVQTLDDLDFTTCVVGRLDPVSRRLVLASAGHLPPLLVDADGTTRYLEVDPGLPLGVGLGRFTEQEVDLPAGSAVLLYTDGLVEDPGEDVDTGLAALRDAAQGPLDSAEELCDRVLRLRGRDGGHDDDIALLALLLDAAAADGDELRPLQLDLPATPQAAGLARQALREVLGQAGRADLVDTALLLVTELVSNAARHVGGAVRLRAGLRAGVLLVEVADEEQGEPVLRGVPDDLQESGRGILLVERLADRWGSDPLPTGKRVWFELG